jgi:hypothetical protein
MTVRACALFVALLTFINLFGDLFQPGFNGSIWWISFGRFPIWGTKLLLAMSALIFLRFAFRQTSRSAVAF